MNKRTRKLNLSKIDLTASAADVSDQLLDLIYATFPKISDGDALLMHDEVFGTLELA